MRTYARTHSTHARKARTHARKHAPRRARMHTCSLRRSTLHFLDFRQMSCLKREPRTQLARLAGTHAGTQARRHAGTQARRQSRSHAATHVQTARGRTHARANARTHAHLHHVHVTHKSRRSTNKIQRGHSSSARTVCDGDRGQANANRRRKLGYATADALRRDPRGVQADGGACCDGR